MKELVAQTQAETVLRMIAIAAPIAGVIIGALVGTLRKRILVSAALGLVIGLTGTAIYGLWGMYNLFGEKYSYMSVASLAVQLVIFAGVGVGAGIVIQRAISAPRSPEERSERTRSTQEEKLNAS